MSTTVAADVVPSETELEGADIAVLVVYFVFIIVVGLWVRIRR